MLRRTENNINHIVERGQRELEERQRNRMYGEFKENFNHNVESDTSLSEMSKGFDSMAIQHHYQVKNQLEEYKQSFGRYPQDSYLSSSSSSDDDGEIDASRLQHS